jgi:hypothetical protein
LLHKKLSSHQSPLTVHEVDIRSLSNFENPQNFANVLGFLPLNRLEITLILSSITYGAIQFSYKQAFFPHFAESRTFRSISKILSLVIPISTDFVHSQAGTFRPIGITQTPYTRVFLQSWLFFLHHFLREFGRSSPYPGLEFLLQVNKYKQHNLIFFPVPHSRIIITFGFTEFRKVYTFYPSFTTLYFTSLLYLIYLRVKK